MSFAISKYLVYMYIENNSRQKQNFSQIFTNILSMFQEELTSRLFQIRINHTQKWFGWLGFSFSSSENGLNGKPILVKN